MIERASSALMFMYVIVAIGGVFFIVVPSPTLSQIAAYGAAVLIWGMFYLVGGLVSALALTLRKFATNTAPLWFFEIGGLCLIIAANLVYSYALFETGMAFDEINVIAASLIILAFSIGLIARVVETIRLVRTLKTYSVIGGAQDE